MKKIWCKIWNFILLLVNQSVELISDVVRSIGNLVVELVDLAAGAIGDGLGTVADKLGIKNILLYAGIGYLLYAVITSNKDDDGRQRQVHIESNPNLKEA